MQGGGDAIQQFQSPNNLSALKLLTNGSGGWKTPTLKSVTRQKSKTTS